MVVPVLGNNGFHGAVGRMALTAVRARSVDEVRPVELSGQASGFEVIQSVMMVNPVMSIWVCGESLVLRCSGWSQHHLFLRIGKLFPDGHLALCRLG